jgi:hypothetical protein
MTEVFLEPNLRLEKENANNFKANLTFEFILLCRKIYSNSNQLTTVKYKEGDDRAER